MKKTKRIRVSALLIDVVEYTFVEWLVRQGLYSAFRSNFDRACLVKASFRDRLRAHIRFVCRSSHFALDSLISTAFLFASTPEGREFWFKRSEDWKCFLAGFVKHC